MRLKKAILGLISVSMCTMFSFGMVVNSAETDVVNIKVGDATVKADKTFSVEVSLNNSSASGLVGTEFAIAYDPTVISITNIVEGSISKTGAKEAELAIVGNNSDYSCFSSNISTNFVSVVWSTGLLNDSSTWIKDDGVFFTIEGNAKDGATGTTSLEIIPIKRTLNGVQNSKLSFATYSNTQVIPLNYTVQNGTLQLGSGTVALNYGDINSDGKPDNMDLVMLCQSLVKDIQLTVDQLKLADVSGDGNVDVADVALLKQYILGDNVKLGR